MDLHRAGSRPDWEAVSPSQRSRWQQIAADTKGIITPGNIVSSAGLIAVFIALILIFDHAPGWGLIILLIGRGADLLDGQLAAATATKSPLGEKIDASFDKIGTGATLVVLAASALMPPVLAVAVILPQAVISLIAYRAYRSGSRLHPSRIGKISMAMAWVCLPVYVAAAIGQWRLGGATFALANVLAGISFVLAAVAAARYYADYKRA